MSSISQVAHEHHDRLMPHVDALARLAGSLGDGAPDGFAAECESEHRFLLGQLLPHIEAIETTLYDELERLMAGRHSMGPMREEHAELRRLITSMGRYHEVVADTAWERNERLNALLMSHNESATMTRGMELATAAWSTLALPLRKELPRLRRRVMSALPPPSR